MGRDLRTVGVLTGALLAAASATGCSTIGRTAGELGRISATGDALEIDGYPYAPGRRPGTFVAGAASRDITPPPGYPTGGHGPAGDVSRGTWMGLKARAFFLMDADGHPLVLVSADLVAAPAGLRAGVARRATERLQEGLGISLPPDALVIAATHTHHGPGNYLSSRVYNQFGSSYSGFARELHDFLVETISDAVVAAALDALAAPAPATLTIRSHAGDYGFLRNRGARTFTLNQERDEALDLLNAGEKAPACQPLPGEPETDWGIPGCPRLRAVDRALTTVEIDRGSGAGRERVGVLVFFAVHPTVLEPDSPLYTPDFTGYAMDAVEGRLGAEGRPVVVGFFNGAEGDVVARRQVRDLREVVAFGERLEAWTLATLASPPVRTEADPAIQVRAGRWRVSGSSDALCVDGEQSTTLSAAPAMGTAALGGAEDDRTLLYDLGWRDGVRDRPRRGQGVKQPALDSSIVRPLRFTAEFAPPEIFPEFLPLVVARVGELTLATVPVEATTAQGLAIRRALGGRGHGTLELIGIANEYLSYCATVDEYAAQDYMGASTLLGPLQGRWMECRLKGLDHGPGIAWKGEAPGQVFWPGSEPLEPFGLQFNGPVGRPDSGLEKVVRDARGLPERGLPWFAWKRASPELVALQPRSGSVTVWEHSSGTWAPVRSAIAGAPEDDRRPGLLTIWMGDDTWSAIWLRALEEKGAGPFAFVVVDGTGKVTCSEPFPGVRRKAAVPHARDCSAFLQRDAPPAR